MKVRKSTSRGSRPWAEPKDMWCHVGEKTQVAGEAEKGLGAWDPGGKPAEGGLVPKQPVPTCICVGVACVFLGMMGMR